jgi:hypothetical protein
MDQSISEIPADVAEVLHLGMVLGQNQAFGLLAGRCSAAQAEALQRLREEKLHLRCASTWKEFCPRFLNMSGKQADYIIRLWQQFGAGFFELSQLTRISAQTYRAIEPAIREGALHFNEEAIELDPENAQKLAAAVAELRRTIPVKEKPAPTIQERLADLEKRCAAIASEFAEIARHPCQEEDRVRFELTLNRASAALQQIESEQPEATI